MAASNDKISIGIDFGTTNTTVCLAVPEGKDVDGHAKFRAECLKFNEDETGNGKDYIPTVVLYDVRPKPDGSPKPPAIGHEAMHPVLDGDTDPATHRLCVHSKFLLGQESLGEEEWRTFLRDNPEYASRDDSLCYDNKEYKPSRVVRDFFRALFDEILRHRLIQAQKPGRAVGLVDLNVVVTCPEAWKHGIGQQLGQQDPSRHSIQSHRYLKEILGQLGLGAVEIKTEPEAATVYFAKHLENAGKEPFSGQVMIVDYGGGTLDICLSRLERKQGGLVVTPELGDHQAVDGRFKAGVKFDETLFELAWHAAEAEQHLGESLDKIKKTPEYVAFLYKLDQEKRDRWVQTSRSLQLVATRKTTEDSPCFGVALDRRCRLRATPSLMLDAFEAANKPTLLQCLAGFNEKLGVSEVERGKLSDKDFRLLMVGGFSRFELVRRTVIEYFGWNPDEDNGRVVRFPDEADTAYAIAKGAALIAAGWARVEAVLPYNIGIVTHQQGKLRRQPLLAVGAKASEYQDWVFYKKRDGSPLEFKANGMHVGVSFFISQGQDFSDIPIDVDKDGRALPSNNVLPDGFKTLRVAFRYDDTTDEPWVRFENAENPTSFKEHRLGELIERVRNRPCLYVDEEMA